MTDYCFTYFLTYFPYTSRVFYCCIVCIALLHMTVLMLCFLSKFIPFYLPVIIQYGLRINGGRNTLLHGTCEVTVLFIVTYYTKH